MVTGAGGFVGSALVSALARGGAAVIAVDRRPLVCPPQVRTSLIADCGPDTRWEEVIAGCDAVVHLAARVHVMRDAAADPLAEYRRVNSAGTLALARQAAAAGVRRLVFVSSVKVNGERTLPGVPFREEDLPAPADPYAVSKLEAEAGLMALATETGMEVVLIRPPLVYGPGVGANFLSMMHWLARGIPLPLGAIKQNRRRLIGLDNLVALITACLRHPAAANQVFLAGDDEALSTTELLRRTAVALGVRARLIPVPIPVLMAGATLAGRRDVALRLCDSLDVDTSKARTLLGWRPPVSVDEGLRRAAAPFLPAGSQV